jgi:hypothetical protein
MVIIRQNIYGELYHNPIIGTVVILAKKLPHHRWSDTWGWVKSCFHEYTEYTYLEE